ncbi:MAG: serine hydrolase [Caldilineaceae bacterium]|nr:serine hydrolase [Caldilineaceae bacterium]
MKNLLKHQEVISALELFSAWTEAQMAYRGHPGMSVGVVHDQTLVWSRGFGYADVEKQSPATAATIYRIASITKTFTSLAVMQLRDEGLLQLDDPVRKHLPWFEIRNPHQDVPEVTIRHLLTHTGGLPREAAFPYWSTHEFPTREEIQQTVPGQELPIPPASDWKYSNLGLALAGEIVEKVSGMPYDRYITDKILRPLGMENTFVAPVPPDHPLFATGYGRRLPDLSRSRAVYADCKGITPAANMASNVEDLAKYMMLHFRSGPRRGKQVLAGSSLREMHRVHWLNSDWSAGRGLGFYVWRAQDRTWVGHGGSLYGYRTEIQFCPDDKVGVIVLTNADDGLPLHYVNKAFEWIVPAVVKAAAPRPQRVVAPENLDQYTGRYRNTWGDAQVIVHNGELVIIYPSEEDPMLGMATLKPVGEHTFRIETKERFGNNGELAVFEMDASGHVVRLKTGNNYIYPVESW